MDQSRRGKRKRGQIGPSKLTHPLGITLPGEEISRESRRLRVSLLRAKRSNDGAAIQYIRMQIEAHRNAVEDQARVELERQRARLRREERRVYIKGKRQARDTRMPHQPSSRGSRRTDSRSSAGRLRAQDMGEVELSYYGPPLDECGYCRAVGWNRERIKKSGSKNQPEFSNCCRNGKIELPPRKLAPEPLRTLLNVNAGPSSLKFLDNIRVYNIMFAMTSTGAKIDNSINGQGAPYIYRISGANYHRIGSLVPDDGRQPNFLQLYVYDTQNEVRNRISAVNQRERNNDIDPSVVDSLMKMLDSENQLVKVFRSARDRYNNSGGQELTLRLVRQRQQRDKTYSQPTGSELAMLTVGNITDSNAERDLVVQTKDGVLKRVSDLHPSFMALQYPLLFPFGEDGYHPHISYLRNTGKRRTKRGFVTAMEFYKYIIQHRRNEGNTLQSSGRLFQQYVVDAYTQIEQQRLRWLRKNQGKLRTDLYQNVYDAFQRGDTDMSKVGMRTILPSSFTGSPRYMIRNYQDAMAICRVFGNPDYFVTFTAYNTPLMSCLSCPFVILTTII